MEEIDEAHIHTAFLVVRVLLFFFLFRFLGAATGVLWSSRGFGSPLAISFIDHAYRISITSPLFSFGALHYYLFLPVFCLCSFSSSFIGITALYTTIGEWGE